MSEQQLITLLKKIRFSSKCAFCSAVVVGIMAHGYAFANKLPNSDDLINIRAYGGTFGLGRWFLGMIAPVLSKFSGNYSTPWLLGMLSVLLISVAAAFVTEALDVQGPFQGMIIGGVLVCFPSITGNFQFMFTSAYYGISILFAALAIWLIARGRNWKFFAGGVAFIALSMGIYQAYYPFIAGTLLCALIGKAFDKKGDIKELWKEAVKYLLCLGAGMILYFCIMKFCNWIFHESLGTHKNIDKMGQIDLVTLPQITIKMYKNMVEVLRSNYLGMSPDLMIQIWIGICYLTVLLFVLISSIRLIKNRDFLRAASGIFFVVIFPAAINLIELMVANSGEGEIYVLMTYALSLIFILPVVLLDSIRKPIADWAVLLCGLGVIYCYANLSNEVYLYTDLAQRSVEAYHNILVTQIKGTEGYSPELEVVFVGNVDDPTLYPLMQEFSNIGIGSVDAVENRVNWYRPMLLKYYCGFAPKYGETYAAEYENFVKEMPCYPRDGSIQVLGGQVIVKLSEEDF